MPVQVGTMRMITAREQSDARRLHDLSETELSRVRTSAEKWRNGTSLSSVLLAAATLVFAPDALAAASTFSLWFTGLFFAAAAATGIASIAFAMRASFGWPTLTVVEKPGTLDAWFSQELHTTLNALRVSLILALVAAVALSVAIGFLFFGPRTTAPPKHIPATTSATTWTHAPYTFAQTNLSRHA